MFDFKTLEFNKVLDNLSNYAFFDDTKKRISSLTPFDNIEMLNESLDQVTEYFNYF